LISLELEVIAGKDKAPEGAYIATVSYVFGLYRKGYSICKDDMIK